MTAQADELDVQLLEPLLRQLIGIIGFPSTMTLVEACGGTRLSVTRNAGNSPRLVELIGTEAATALGRAMAQEGVDRILVPKATKAMLAARNRRILAELQTCSVCETARRWRLSERMVYYVQVRHGRVAESPNLPLFD